MGIESTQVNTTCWYHNGRGQERKRAYYFCNECPSVSRDRDPLGRFFCYECSKFHGWHGSHRLRRTPEEVVERRSEYMQGRYNGSIKTQAEQIRELTQELAVRDAKLRSVQRQLVHAESRIQAQEITIAALRVQQFGESVYGSFGRQHTKAAPTELQKAFAVFGMLPGVSKELFDAHFAKCMFKYHPDRNTAVDANKRAAEMNAARDVIYAQKGWK